MRLFKYPAHTLFSLTLICFGILGFSTFILPPTQAQNGQQLTIQPDITGTWRRGGPDGGTLRALAVHPTNPAIMFAGGIGGLFRSTDSGAHWVECTTGLSSFFIRTIAITPSNPSVMYLGTASDRPGGFNLYKSVNGGDSWVPATTGLGFGSAESLVINPQNPNNLYLILGGTVYQSTDAAASWVLSNGGLPDFAARDQIVLAPTNPQTLYVTCGTLGVYQSLNGGTTWTPVNNGLPTGVTRSLAIDPQTPGTLYVGYFSQGLYKTVNGGGNWVQLSLPEGAVFNLQVTPGNHNQVYAGTDFGVYQSNDAGITWIQLTGGLPQILFPALALAPSSQEQVLAGSENGGLFRTTNAGASWTAINTGLFLTDGQAVALDPSNPNILYAGLQDGVNSGLVKSTDGARTWARLNTGQPSNIFSLAVHPTNPNLVLAGGSPGFRSTNGGTSWSILTGLPNNLVSTLAFARSNPNLAYATVPQFGVYQSTDAGASWTPRNSGLTDLLIDAIGVDPTNPNRVFAASGGGKIYGSTDGGGNWSLLHPGLPGAGTGSGFLVDPYELNTLYAGFRNGGIYKSTDGGATWVNTNNGVPANVFGLSLAPASPGTLFVTNSYGVFRSTDRGLSWIYLTTGGLNSGNLTEIAVTPQATSLYVAGRGGVFALDNDTCPTVTQFYPIATVPGKTITITGTNFVPGTQVFFGGPRLIPAASVTVDSTTQIRVVVPPSGTGAGNINGYLTIRAAGCPDVTTESLPVNVANPGDPSSTFPRFVLLGDTSMDGKNYNTNDLALERAFLQFQVIPTADQKLAGDVLPVNSNGSRGNGSLTTTDFTFMRAEAFGQFPPD
ncbi:MAG: IPT/TIG domain-containing protein [Blastocatellia bacterium]|nr:IPT/TIG domain-containing protein [Blastocatellia bacterium]